MVQAVATVPSLPVPVLNVPHWRIVIHPKEFDARRIVSRSECWDLVSDLAVRWRGRDFPFADSSRQSAGESWVASSTDWEGELEYWRFFQSGQFVYLRSIDDQRRVPPKSYQPTLRRAAQDFQPSGPFRVEETIYFLTEVWEFASRLSARGVLGEPAVVDVSAVGVQDRVLTRDDIHKFGDPYVCRRERLQKAWDAAGLAAPEAAYDAARAAATWIFEYFGWLSPDDELIRRLQREFVEASGPFSGWVR